MRTRVERNQRHTARGVSLSPQMTKAALRRASDLDLSFSKYVQKLIDVDLNRKLLRVVEAA